ncbi:hypothetical protein HPP92_018396 [Vanilla planifolia]|uniref:Clp R domain-containing protein n=1 Tax=Vanilla planifolia TaxID=51239 RepID=A0A835QI00_VANPL|nr:hypothetical protein HPP92_018396 [Vanilla planifolia]
MLVGVGAAEAAGDFIRALERRKWEGMPQEIHGLRIASIERVLGDGNPDDIYEKLEKVGKESEDFRIALSIGDMQRLLEVSEEVIGRLVSEVTRVLELRPGKLWVLGWSATYETYLKFLSRYPLLEKDWALQLLPITSHRAGFGGLHPKPPSIMGSFVPFGGLFSPVEPMDNSSRPFKSMTRCLLCNEKYEQEVFSIQKGSCLSLESLHQLSIPSWLKRGDAVDMVEEDKDLLNARIVNLQKKWNKYCRDVHGRSEMLKTNNSQALLHFDNINCTSSVEVCCKNTMNPYATQNQSIRKDECTIPVGATKTIPICTGIMSALASVPTNSNLISNLQDKLSDGKSLRNSGLESQQAAPLDLSSRAQHSTSPITSVPTDLVLGSVQEPFCLEGKPAFSVRVDQSQGSSESSTPIKISGSAQNVSEDHVSPHFVLSNTDSAAKSVDLYARFPSNVKSNPSAFSNEQWCLSTSNICQKFDSTNDKSLYMSLLGKVGRQEEALLAISEAIIHCKARSDKYHGTSLRDDIWLCFHGADRVGKKMAAMALAESIFGSSDNLICIDLAYLYDTFCTNTAFEDRGLKVRDTCLRGETIIDHISMEIRTKPLSVFFLENVDKADLPAQSGLSNAIRTGKFSDSHGREFSINSSIFVVAAKAFPGAGLFPREEIVTFSEERILAVHKCQMKILIEPPSDILISSPDCKVSNVTRKDSRSMYVPHHPVVISKRKMDSIEDQNRLSGPFLSVKKSRQNLGMVFDLNLPVVEALDQCGDCSSSNEVSSALGNSEAWFEELISMMDATVSFKPFDFDALSDYVLKEIGQHLRKEIGPNCMLEIDVRVMEQILAATWLLKNKHDLTEWIEKVLMRSLADLRDKKGSSASTVFRLIGCQELLKENQPWAFLPLTISLQ